MANTKITMKSAYPHIFHTQLLIYSWKTMKTTRHGRVRYLSIVQVQVWRRNVVDDDPRRRKHWTMTIDVDVVVVDVLLIGRDLLLVISTLSRQQPSSVGWTPTCCTTCILHTLMHLYCANTPNRPVRQTGAFYPHLSLLHPTLHPACSAGCLP